LYAILRTHKHTNKHTHPHTHIHTHTYKKRLQLPSDCVQSCTHRMADTTDFIIESNEIATSADIDTSICSTHRGVLSPLINSESEIAASYFRGLGHTRDAMSLGLCVTVYGIPGIPYSTPRVVCHLLPPATRKKWLRCHELATGRTATGCLCARSGGSCRQAICTAPEESPRPGEQTYRKWHARECKCVAECCSVLQCVAVCCSVLQCGNSTLRVDTFEMAREEM